MAAPQYYTADMVLALPDDGQRYETVYGELLVTPAPRAWHQEIIERLRVSLRPYLARNPVGHLFSAPADISWSDNTLVQPDLFVVDPAEARTMDWSKMKTLLLVVEVLSPSTARHDRVTKRRLYQERRIPEYWIVDPDHAAVDVWKPDWERPQRDTELLTWSPSGDAAPLVISLAELFHPL